MIYVFILLLLSYSDIIANNDIEEAPNKRKEWRESTFKNQKVSTPANFEQMQRMFSKSLPNAPEGFSTKGNEISSQTWMHAGPDNIGGRTRVVAYDKNNSNILIAGGVSGGVWRSVDGGQSWVQTTGIQEISSVTTIIQDPRPGKGNNWYCAGGELSGNSASHNFNAYYTGNGVYKSTDNGISWQSYGITGDFKPESTRFLDFIHRLAIDPSNQEDDILYLACHSSIIRVSENGSKLESALDLENFNAANRITDILITPSAKFYVTLSYYSPGKQVSHHGIFYSEDGYSWMDISPDFLQPSYRIVMDYAESDENILYFFSSNVKDVSTDCDYRYDECYSLFRLDNNDGYFNWTNLSKNLPYLKSKNDYNYLMVHRDYCMALKICPTDPEIVFLAGANCYVSYDGFYSDDRTQWIAGYNPDYDPYKYDPEFEKYEYYKNILSTHFENGGGWDFHYFAFNPDNPMELIAASDPGLQKLADISENKDKYWVHLNNGYYTSQFYDCAINKHVAGSDDIIGGLQDNNTLGNLEDNSKFTRYLPGDGMSCYITAYGSILVSSQYSNIARLDLKNGKVVDYDYIFRGVAQQLAPQFRTIFAVNPNDEKEIALATNQAILICNDIMQDFSQPDYTGSIIDNLNATCMEYGASKEKALFIGTSNKSIYKVTDFSDDDLGYEVIYLPQYVTGEHIIDLWIDPSDNDHFVAIVSSYLSLGMLETTDGGKTWTDHGGNLEEEEDGFGAGHSFRCYEKIVINNETLHLLGTSDGLFSTKNLEGKNTVWQREGANTIGKALIEDIEVRELDGRIVIATHGNGLFKTNFSTSVEEFDGNNLGFVVSEVFPNPATDKINFILHSDQNSNVEVKLIDMQGNTIANIISAQLSGTKNISYDASELSTGTYFINISDGKHYITKKINIVR